MKRGSKPSQTIIRQQDGGISIGGGTQVRVGGDMVGRDKITSISTSNQEIEDLFAQLIEAIQANSSLGTNEKNELITKSQELKGELQKADVDLGKIVGIKQLLMSKGEWIAGAVGAIFQYQPIQEAIMIASKRLIGG